jgi:hypothetical protein
MFCRLFWMLKPSIIILWDCGQKRPDPMIEITEIAFTLS